MLKRNSLYRQGWSNTLDVSRQNAIMVEEVGLVRDGLSSDAASNNKIVEHLMCPSAAAAASCRQQPAEEGVRMQQISEELKVYT